MIEDESGAAVGHLWIAAERIEGRERLYVYDVEIIESERGRGSAARRCCWSKRRPAPWDSTGSS